MLIIIIYWGALYCEIDALASCAGLGFKLYLSYRNFSVIDLLTTKFINVEFIGTYCEVRVRYSAHTITTEP